MLVFLGTLFTVLLLCRAFFRIFSVFWESLTKCTRNNLLDSPRKIILNVFQCPKCCCWSGCRNKHNSLILDIKGRLEVWKKNLNTLHDYLNDRNCFSFCSLKIKIPLIHNESNYNSNCAQSSSYIYTFLLHFKLLHFNSVSWTNWNEQVSKEMKYEWKK